MAILPSWAIHRSPCDVYVHSKTPQIFLIVSDVPFISLASTMSLVYINCVYRDILYIHVHVYVYIYMYISWVYIVVLNQQGWKAEAAISQSWGSLFRTLAEWVTLSFQATYRSPHCVRSCFPSGHRLSVLDDQLPNRDSFGFMWNCFFGPGFAELQYCNFMFCAEKAWHFWDYHITFWNTNAVRC